MTTTGSTPAGVRWGSAQARGVLAATVVGSGMAMLDGTIVNVALPRIGAELTASVSGLQWILDGYLLALAALILVAGSLGDSPFTQTTKARDVKVKLSRKVLYELDGGDRTKVKSFKVKVEPRAISVCVPPQKGSV